MVIINSNIIAVTLEIEHDKIQETPKINVISKNKTSCKNKCITPENDFEEVEYLSLYSVFQVLIKLCNTFFKK